ncbi:hypothetical protein [Halopenitus sp. POP-27]|nr:hypothetical protein [Halopenitus sp. POP-27]
MTTTPELNQGIREHLGQFSLHVLLVFATGRFRPESEPLDYLPVVAK